MMFSSILFDLDGTLTDSYEGITRCVQYALAAQGIEVEDRAQLRCFIGPPLTEQFMAFANMDREQAAQAVAKYRERYTTVGLFENQVYDGVPQMLAALRAQGKRLAVATSKPEVFAVQIVEHFGLKQYFDTVVGSELSGARTDKAEVIREALRRLDIDETDVVMVGDRNHDVIGAKTCGIPCVGVAYGYAEPGELEQAGALQVAQDAEALLDILL